MLAGRRLVAIDGTCLDLADTPANTGFFGRPASSRGEQSAFPQARVVALAECGTHAILDAATGPCSTSEIEMARELVARLKPGMLALADRGFRPNRATTAPLTVRVIDYTIDDGRDNPEEYRLLTTILDLVDAGAEDLAAAYAQRWEIENTSMN